ncbi:helix-turn-helix domain-containing protein [Fibrella aquatilis]|uniref:Helix-turn-helix transcriptional regulator n=1 Tax=Fibrella aquatilis TaxID=2817059 RepID=A0A939G484_9BACT|nr:helix-turn-helix transcriptional regulator [Fibrella aquatilis]MBO0930329.1 helix-turn-helix transcriptional regulator [Fibrella aquatilis]
MEQIISSDLGYRLKLLRQKLGVTCSQTAEEADIPLPVLRKIEQGHTANPGFYVAEKLAKRYKVNTNWLILGVGDMFTDNHSLAAEVDELKEELERKEDLLTQLHKAFVELRKKIKRVASQPDVNTPDSGIFPDIWPRQRPRAVTNLS